MYRDNSTCSHEQGMQGNLLNKPINHVILAYPLFKQTHFKELPSCHVDMEMENRLVLKRQIVCKWRIVHCDGRLPTRLRSQEGDFKRLIFYYSNHMQRPCHVIFPFFGWVATTGNDSMQPLTTG